jgi:hypothetical protein
MGHNILAFGWKLQLACMYLLSGMCHTNNQTCKLIQKVSTHDANKAMCRAVMFSKVNAVFGSGNNAVLQLDQAPLDLDALERLVADSQTPMGTSERQDVLAVLSCRPSSRLHSLVIYRMGCVVVSVRLSHNDGERCAYVNINNYRAMLEVLAASATCARNSLLQGLLFGFLVSVLSILCMS